MTSSDRTPPDRSAAAVSGGRRALLVLGIVAFALVTAGVNWIKYESLRSSWAYDLGFFHNVAFNRSLGRDTTYLLVSSWFKPGDFEGPSIYRSNHFSPLRLVVNELYRLSPHVVTLMLLQSLLVGSGAAALHGFATRRTRDARAGAFLAAAYLLNPAVLHMAFGDYRDIALGIGPALWALSFHASRRMALFLAAALVMLAARPEWALLLAAFGILNARQLPAGTARWLWILAPIVAALLWGAATNAYYLHSYGVPWPILERATSGAGSDVAAKLFGRIPAFFATLLAPAFVGLGTPEAFAVALPFVAKARSVVWPDFPHRDLQHLSPAVVAVFWAFACTVVRLWPTAGEGARRALAAVVLASFLPFAAGTIRAYPLEGIAEEAEIGRLADELPDDATVVVPKTLAARFSRHTRVLVYETPPFGRPMSETEARKSFAKVFAIADVVVTRGGRLFRWLASGTGRFEKVRRIGEYEVYVARADARRPEEPDRELQEALRWDRLPAIKRSWAPRLAVPPAGTP